MAVEFRHHQVGNDEVESAFARQFHCLTRICHLCDLVIPLKGFCQNRQHFVIVVYKEDGADGRGVGNFWLGGLLTVLTHQFGFMRGTLCLSEFGPRCGQMRLFFR